MRAPKRALPHRRALCTNWKKPRSFGSLSCEMSRCGRSQERSSDQKPPMVLTCTSLSRCMKFPDKGFATIHRVSSTEMWD